MFYLLGGGFVLMWGWNEYGICGMGNEVNVYIFGVVFWLEDFRVYLIGCGGVYSFVVINRWYNVFLNCIKLIFVDK